MVDFRELVRCKVIKGAKIMYTVFFFVLVYPVIEAEDK